MTSNTRDTQSLLDRMERQSSERRTPRVQINRSANGARSARRAPLGDEKHSADQVMEFEIFYADHPAVIGGKRAPDEELVIKLKNEINEAGITRRDLYAFVGEGPGKLFETENQAYNLDYGLRKRPTITMDCARRWLAVLGKNVKFVFYPIGEEDDAVS